MSSREISVVLAVMLLALGTTGLSARTLVVGTAAPTIQQTIEKAAPGDVVEVPAGRWNGPVIVNKTITLRGTGGIIDGQGKGKVLIVTAPETIIENLTVRASGNDLGGPDSCIYLKKSAHRSIIRGNIMRDCAFGLWLHEANHVKILNNKVFGRSHLVESDRGNGIHLFDGSHLVVRGNEVIGARDGIYISAVDDSIIEANRLSKQRYGVHYMFSYRNTLKNNVSFDNLTGFALMQSHYLVIVGNRAVNNRRHGILFRDAQYSRIQHNELRNNGEGLFFFSSTENTITDNLIIKNRIGARIWAGTRRNVISNNAFIANGQQIYYVGAKDQILGDGKHPGNYWSDYAGWDQDGDGIGDRAYRMDNFTSRLLYRYPGAVLLLRSPALELLSHLEAELPLLRVPTIVDRRPLMRWRRKP